MNATAPVKGDQYVDVQGRMMSQREIQGRFQSCVSGMVRAIQVVQENKTSPKLKDALQVVGISIAEYQKVLGEYQVEQLGVGSVAFFGSMNASLDKLMYRARQASKQSDTDVGETVTDLKTILDQLKQLVAVISASLGDLDKMISKAQAEKHPVDASRDLS